MTARRRKRKKKRRRKSILGAVSSGSGPAVTRTRQMMSEPWRTGCLPRHPPCPALAGRPFLLFGSGSWVPVPALYMRLVEQESLCSVSACSMGLRAILVVSTPI